MADINVIQGPNVTVKITGAERAKKLIEIYNFNTTDFRAWAKLTGIKHVAFVDKNFKTEGVTGTGKRWQQVKDPVAKARRGSSRILIGDRTLQQSNTFQIRNFGLPGTRAGLGPKYSAVHNQGGKFKVKKHSRKTKTGSAQVKSHTREYPQRRMLPSNDQAKRLHFKALNDIINRKLRRSGFGQGSFSFF